MGLSRAKAKRLGLTPKTSIGGRYDNVRANRQGKPTVRRGLAKIGALLRSSSLTPLKPTRLWSLPSLGIQPTSNPSSTEPGSLLWGVSSPAKRETEVK